MTAALRVVRIGIHVLVFVVAVVIFYVGLGLGIGLTLNPTLGSLLWIASFATIGINIFWMVRRPPWR